MSTSATSSSATTEITQSQSNSASEGGIPPPSQHASSVVGSVLEASDGVGGKCYIRLQNISATGKLYREAFCYIVTDISHCSYRWKSSTLVIRLLINLAPAVRAISSTCFR